ncbi:MAG: aspartate 1-decarboxylase [Bdellovibrionaceae bacterium]|nr:aspartate 1-decarboxylase [Pseudobdellovibrionaceae bacterium]
MKVDMMYSKIHRATVTNADLTYEGSISIDQALIKKAKLHVNQKVDILNCNNGARFSTYVIEGKKQQICLNGAAARHVQKGDVVIIVAYASIPLEQAESFKPTVIFVDSKNNFSEERKEKRDKKSKY